MPTGTLSAASDPARPGTPTATSPDTSAAANPAKWKCATVNDNTVSEYPNSSQPPRSATSASPATDGVTSAVSRAIRAGRNGQSQTLIATTTSARQPVK